MNTFKNLFRSPLRRFAKNRPQPNRVRARLSLEGLETRLVPASVFVVPISQLPDSSHFHTLGEAAVAAGVNGSVTIEPGASPDPAAVTVNLFDIHIQGDPNVPASILPAYQLSIQAGLAHLVNLNISSLVVGVSAATPTVAGAQVHNCLINTLTAFDSGSTYSQNTITGSASFDQGGNGQEDTISNNTFASSLTTVLSLFRCAGTTVSQNVFFVQGTAVAIVARDCHSFSGGPNTIPTSFSNNTMSSPGSNLTAAMVVIQDGTGVSDVRILNNSFNTGTGLTMAMAVGDDAHFRAFVQGNDFHNDAVGVSVVGDGAHAGTIDMGGGPLGSLGGNNFRSFTANATASHAAISIGFAQSGSVMATSNMFDNNIMPSNVVFLTNAAIPNLGGPLSTPQSFIQAMYNELLGRTGSLAELNGWVPVLTAQGQAAVVNDILRSPESLGRIVDAFYLRFLGRQSDASGRTIWVTFLENGGTEEQLENAFLTSPEYLGHINTDFVQSLYINILDRTGAANELAGWNNLIQQLGLGGIANSFIESAENRSIMLNTYFQTFLHRAPTTVELNIFVNSSADLLSLEGMVLSLPEYFTNG